MSNSAIPWNVALQPRDFPGKSTAVGCHFLLQFLYRTEWQKFSLTIPTAAQDAENRISFTLLRASLVAQLVKNWHAMQETWVWSLGWEDPLEKGMAPHSSILAWRIPTDRGNWWGHRRAGHDWARVSTGWHIPANLVHSVGKRAVVKVRFVSAFLSYSVLALGE